MRVMRLSNSAEAPVLVEGAAPRPEPGPGEVLVRVVAAGVTPTEVLWYPTTHTKTGDARTGAVPGHEFSGVVEAVGEGVGGFADGDEVYGINDWFGDGATAEYAVAAASWLARKPSSLSHVEAASVPIGALTAWQGLFDRARLAAGERVLVNGAAGAVGVYVVQLAHRHGARVIATASARNIEFLTGLGAERVIDYHATRFEDEVVDVDVVFDCVGGETLDRSWSVLAPGGRLVAISADAEGTDDERVKQAFFIFDPNHEQLATVAGLLDSGELRPVVDTVVPFAQAPAAYAGKAEGRRGRGKVVIEI